MRISRLTKKLESVPKKQAQALAHACFEEAPLVLQAMRAAARIGYASSDKSVLGEIADLILDSLDELVRMPLEPPP